MELFILGNIWIIINFFFVNVLFMSSLLKKNITIFILIIFLVNIVIFGIFYKLIRDKYTIF